MYSLYRHFDEKNNLLYVGATVCPLYRTAQHKTSPWFDRVAKITIEKFETPNLALIAEDIAISTENPEFNTRKKLKEKLTLSERDLKAAYLPVKLAAAYLCVNKTTLDQWRHRGSGPKFYKPGGRNVYYEKAELDRWINKHKAGQ